MGERYVTSAVNRNLLTAAVVLAVAGAVAAVIVIAALPIRYCFLVKGGQLSLWKGKIVSVDGQRVESVTSFAVGEEDFQPLLRRSFETEEEARQGLRSFLFNRVGEMHGDLMELEKQLAGPYADLLEFSETARAQGVEGLEPYMGMIRQWLDYHQRKLELWSRMQEKRASEAPPQAEK